MKIRLVVAVAVLSAALSATAEPSVRFHVRATDGRTALHANPKFSELTLTEKQVDRAAHDQVLLVDHTSGLQWGWLMLSYPKGHGEREYGLDAKGVAATEKSDFALRVGAAATAELRCLHEHCDVTVMSPTGKTNHSLAKGESALVPLDSDIALAFR